jgi:hypothetical protein
MNYIGATALNATLHRPLKPHSVSWAKGFERRRPELVVRKNKPRDWSWYSIYDKVNH